MGFSARSYALRYPVLSPPRLCLSPSHIPASPLTADTPKPFPAGPCEEAARQSRGGLHEGCDV